jgi:hypothetical protein
MYNLKIGEDTADLLIRDVLKQDYRRICDSIAELEARTEELQPFQQEDLDFEREVRDALIVMMKYYLTLDEAYEVINQKTD